MGSRVVELDFKKSNKSRIPKSFLSDFYRTQVYLGSNLWVRVSVADSTRVVESDFKKSNKSRIPKSF